MILNRQYTLNCKGESYCYSLIKSLFFVTVHVTLHPFRTEQLKYVIVISLRKFKTLSERGILNESLLLDITFRAEETLSLRV